MSNKYYILFFSISLLLMSCVGTKIPDGWLPDENEGFCYNANGAYLYIEFGLSQRESESFSKGILSTFSDEISLTDSSRLVSVRGEFLGVAADTVFLVSNSDILYRVSANKISYAQLDYGERSAGLLAVMGGLGMVSAIFNGKFLIFSEPLWITSLAVGLTGETQRDLFYQDNPNIDWFNNLTPFARFPQGIGPDIDLSKIISTPHVQYFKTDYRK